MKITVINGTEQQGVTYRLKEIFLQEFGDTAEVTEFYLPKDCPGFCAGCKVCFFKDEHLCKDAENIQKIEKALKKPNIVLGFSADLCKRGIGCIIKYHTSTGGTS